MLEVSLFDCIGSVKSLCIPVRQSGMEKRPFGRQKSGRFQEQTPTILNGNSDLEKRNFLTAKFVAVVEPQSRQNSSESSNTTERKKGGI